MKILFISGLDASINDNNLKELFNQFGTTTSAKVLTDPTSGKSYGCGFVEMSNNSEAENCINKLNHTIHLDRTLIVEFKDNSMKRSKSRSRSFMH